MKDSIYSLSSLSVALFYVCKNDPVKKAGSMEAEVIMDRPSCAQISVRRGPHFSENFSLKYTPDFSFFLSFI